jgi:predicted RNA-binding protein associated with RNAse of E/G family
MSNPVIYRKRLIPAECIELHDDVIMKATPEYIVTSWNALKPKRDLDHGFSCYYLNRGYKISRFCDRDNSLLYWYCDIVSYSFSDDKDRLTVTDLLVDVIIYPDGFVKVVDLDELVTASRSGLLTGSQLETALICLHKLLTEIYAGNLSLLTDPISKISDQ